MATLENIDIANNDFQRSTPSLLWTGVNVRDNSMASVANFIIRESTNVQNMVSAKSYSMVNVQNSIANDLFGGREAVCASFVCIAIQNLNSFEPHRFYRTRTKSVPFSSPVKTPILSSKEPTLRILSCSRYVNRSWPRQDFAFRDSHTVTPVHSICQQDQQHSIS
jgi:hypothetical protein